MRKTNMMLGLIAAVGAAVALPGAGQATISLVANGGLPSYAEPEIGGTFPTLLQGTTNPATLNLTPGTYDFAYTGKGNSVNTNFLFQNGNSISTASGPTTFTLPVLSAVDLAFSFVSSAGCSIRSGQTADTCAYLVAVESPTVAYLGFSDSEGRSSNMPPPGPPIIPVNGAADYQDMTIKITQREIPVPEPASLGLLGLGLIGLGMLRRRQQG